MADKILSDVSIYLLLPLETWDRDLGRSNVEAVANLLAFRILIKSPLEAIANIFITSSSFFRRTEYKTNQYKAMQTNIKHKHTMFAKEKWEGSTFLLAGRQCQSLDSGSLFIVLQFELAKFAGGFKKGLFSVFWRTWCFEIGKTNVDIADLVHFSNNGGIAGTRGQFADCTE